MGDNDAKERVVMKVTDAVRKYAKVVIQVEPADVDGKF